MKFNKSLDWLKESDEENLLGDDELDVVDEELNEGLYVDPANYDKHSDLVDVVDKAGNPQKMTQATYNKNKGSGEFKDAEPKAEPKEKEQDKEVDKTQKIEKPDITTIANKVEELSSNPDELIKDIKSFGNNIKDKDEKNAIIYAMLAKKLDNNKDLRDAFIEKAKLDDIKDYSTNREVASKTMDKLGLSDKDTSIDTSFSNISDKAAKAIKSKDTLNMLKFYRDTAKYPEGVFDPWGSRYDYAYGSYKLQDELAKLEKSGKSPKEVFKDAYELGKQYLDLKKVCTDKEKEYEHLSNDKRRERDKYNWVNRKDNETPEEQKQREQNFDKQEDMMDLYNSMKSYWWNKSRDAYENFAKNSGIDEQLAKDIIELTKAIDKNEWLKTAEPYELQEYKNDRRKTLNNYRRRVDREELKKFKASRNNK